jgi:CBS domain containing-hemolysin-like protein
MGLIAEFTSAAGATGAGGNITLLIVYFGSAVIASFSCSLSEAVLLSVTNPFIAHLKKGHPVLGERLERLKGQVDRPLTAILTLNTVANTMGTYAVGKEFGQLALVGGWGGWTEGVAAGVLCTVILIVGEIIPKTLGATYWRQLAPAVAVMLEWMSFITAPVIWFIQLFRQGSKNEATFSREELKVMAEIGKSEGKLRESELRILHNLLHLRENTVQDVMTPRVVVFSLPCGTTVRDFLARHAATPFSRIPLYGEDKDDIRGFVLKTDVLLAAAKDRHEQKLDDIMRDVISLPATTRLTDAFETLVEQRNHLAVLVDEFGLFAGLVTMEDIVETLLGLEIVDEADQKEDMQAYARRMWVRRARRMGIDLDEQAADDGTTL